MKLRICPTCDTHNALSSWCCGKCDHTLSMDTICELDDDLVNIYEPNGENGTDKEIDKPQSLLDTPRLDDLRLVAQQEKGAEMAIAAVEEREKQRKELILEAIRYNSSHYGWGTQPKIVGKFEYAGYLGIEVLLNLLEEGSLNLQGVALAILGSMKTAHAVEPLVNMYPSAKPDIRQGIVGILSKNIYGHVGGLGASYIPSYVNPVWMKKRRILIIGLFTRALKDEKTRIRYLAVSTISNYMKIWIRIDYDFSILVDNLIDTLSDGQEGVQKLAAIALGDSKDPRAIKPLELAISDKKRSVRKAAQKSIKRLEKDLESQ